MLGVIKELAYGLIGFLAIVLFIPSWFFLPLMVFEIALMCYIIKADQ